MTPVSWRVEIRSMVGALVADETELVLTEVQVRELAASVCVWLAGTAQVEETYYCDGYDLTAAVLSAPAGPTWSLVRAD